MSAENYTWGQRMVAEAKRWQQLHASPQELDAARTAAKHFAEELGFSMDGWPVLKLLLETAIAWCMSEHTQAFLRRTWPKRMDERRNQHRHGDLLQMALGRGMGEIGHIVVRNHLSANDVMRIDAVSELASLIEWGLLELVRPTLASGGFFVATRAGAELCGVILEPDRPILGALWPISTEDE